MKLLVTSCAFLFSIQLLFAQTVMSTSEKIEEVYGTEFITNNPQAFLFLKNLLNERIELEYQQNVDSTKYTPISTVPVMNKYNTSLTPFNTDNFTPENFNPLHYQINFTNSKQDQFFWLDNTSYLLIIRRQK